MKEDSKSGGILHRVDTRAGVIESNMANFASLLQSGEFSDLHITCNGAERKLHRAIICAQSSVFNTMCTAPFQVCSFLSFQAPASDLNEGVSHPQD